MIGFSILFLFLYFGANGIIDRQKKRHTKKHRFSKTQTMSNMKTKCKM